MQLRPLTDGKVSGTGMLKIEGRVLGAVLISSDNTNAVTVTIRIDDSEGLRIFDICTVAPLFPHGQISTGTSQMIYYSVTGIGGAAQIYEWVE